MKSIKVFNPLLVLFLFFLILSCKTKNNLNDKNETIKSSQSEVKNINYSTDTLTIRHSFRFGKDTSKYWNRTITLPVTGKFVQEAHYVTTLDSFPNGKLFADSLQQNIGKHLKRSYDIYLKFDSTIYFNELYKFNYQKEWTPAESGKIGQGSVGNIQKKELTPEMELWMVNMMWADNSKPKRGTRFLLSFKNKKVIVLAGYETGPSQKEFIGGVTREVHAWLGSNNNSEIKIEYLVNQNLPLGPIKN